MSEISKQALKVDNNTSFPNNTTGYISPTILRAFNVNMIDSLVEQEGYNDDSSSWNVSIGALQSFTASQQPSFNQLNAFTSSQLSINSGINLFTQSASGRLNNLESTTSSLNAWSSSVNEIIVNGVGIGYSTRLFFNGYVSASIVPNVGGPIASITVLADQTFATSASFNAYTASTNDWTASAKVSITSLNAFTASQNSFNSSATASLQELLNLSSSLSGGYATQGELDQSASVLQNNINVSSSVLQGNIDVLSSFTGSYATTGSNSFNGNQIITGSVYISSSATVDLRVEGQVYISSSATGGTTAPRLTVSGSAGTSTINRNSITTRNLTQSAALNPLAIFASVISTSDEIGFSVDPVAGGVSGWTTGPTIYINNDALDTYPAVFGFQNKANYTDGRVAVLIPLSASAGIIDARISGSTLISGSLTITGSVYGNVVSASITSNTASIDLSLGSFFQLALPNGVITNINITNPKPGVTAILEITNTGIPSASFSSNVKQQRFNTYLPSSGSGTTDLLSVISLSTSSVYVANSLNFV
jgi:hypothetical protein